MSKDNVRAFMDRSSTDLDLRKKCHDSLGVNADTTATNIANVAATAGLAFSADEYKQVVDEDYKTLFVLHRVIIHAQLLKGLAAD